jgi:hypothetical protein
MKYFTAELWSSWSDPAYQPPPRERDPFVLYRKELETLRHRLRPRTFAFFAEADVHDGRLVEFAIREGVRVRANGTLAPAPRRPARFPVVVELCVVDGAGRFAWTLEYRGVRRVEARYAADEYGNGFDGWGYHELSDAGGGFLQHEILFASDASLLVEFAHVVIKRRRADRAGCRTRG